jgi:hypothetical protein
VRITAMVERDFVKPSGSDRWRLEPFAMSGETTIAGQIERLIVRLDGAAVCDTCVTDRLSLPAPAQANSVTRALAGQRGYERLKDQCTLCGTTKTVIRHAGKQA